MTATAALVPSPAQRRTDYGLGASEAAVAIGVSDYRRPIDLWLEKTKRREPFSGNEKTFWGNALEPIIRAHYVEKHGVAVHVPPESLFHRELTFVRATPDGIVLDESGRWEYVAPQVKNVGLRMAPHWQGDGGERTAPTDYYVQAVIEMAVTDLPRLDFAVLMGGQEYFEVTIERNLEIEGEVLGQLAAFWDLVEHDRQPPLDDSDSFRGHLLRQIKRRTEIVPATATDIKLIERWREVAVQMLTLKREEKSIKSQLAARLSDLDAGKLTSPLGDITVGAAAKKTSWKAVAEQLGATVPSFEKLDRELAALGSENPPNPTLAKRVESLRSQLKLLGALTDYKALVAKNTKSSDPSLKRPTAWTKGIEDDTNEEG